MCIVHPVFYMSILELVMSNIFSSQSEPLPPPVIIDDELKYKISRIVDLKIDYRCICKLLYKVI